MRKSKLTVTGFLAVAYFLCAAQANPPPKTSTDTTFSSTGQQFDLFFDRVRAKISYSWQQCGEHFRLMFTAVGDRSKYGEQDLKKRAWLKTEELSEEAARFGRNVRDKALDLGKDTAKKGETFYKKKSDDIADDIEEKTRQLQKELRDKTLDIYQETGKRFNKAADDAAETVLKQ